jgi:SAM-dependent methyltransferase
VGEPTDFTKPEFWDARYASGTMAWNRQQAPLSLESFLKAAVPGSVLIPGCGAGAVIPAFDHAGWKVKALDFSPVAVEQARTRLADLGKNVLLADFFQHDFGAERFEVSYEQAFLCALPPDLWPDYARRMAQLLHPGGRLVGLFFCGQEPEPPPYPLDEAKAQELFGPSFCLLKSVPVPDPHPFYSGGERWMEWELRAPARQVPGALISHPIEPGEALGSP